MNLIVVAGISGVGTLEANLYAMSDQRSHDRWQPTAGRHVADADRCAAALERQLVEPFEDERIGRAPAASVRHALHPR